ncbi:MAG: serine/threonine-protein kinase [Candidatus Eremiobacteraeota bacterium]|nr:serine/threonine-protein kinase [Candidatus Eremiobacteraeota bacterium]
MLKHGDVVNQRYRVARTIGGGSYGTVYMVEDLNEPGKAWAMKEVVEASLPEEERADAREMFSREAAILQKLDHPGLPAMTDFFSQGDCHYLVMEYIEGDTLETLLKIHGKPFTSDEVQKWAVQLAAILDYLHGQKPDAIIFRDLKPSNIMESSDGWVRLVDFGIARFFVPGKVKDTFLMGTPGFSPPEQYGSGQSDERADIYSLGATLYYLLTGDDVASFSFKFPPLSKKAQVPPWFEKVVMKCLAPNPGERYQSAAHVLSDLEHEAFGTVPPKRPQGPAKITPGGPVAIAFNAVLSIFWLFFMVSFIGCIVIGKSIYLLGIIPVFILMGAGISLVSTRFLGQPLQWYPTTLLEVIIIFIILVILGSALVPHTSRPRYLGQLTACKSNLKSIATALDMYQSHEGKYPLKLRQITPHYLEDLPRCPAADSGRYGYCRTKALDHFIVYCKGRNHEKAEINADYPQYDSVKGLIENRP